MKRVDLAYNSFSQGLGKRIILAVLIQLQAGGKPTSGHSRHALTKKVKRASKFLGFNSCAAQHKDSSIVTTDIASS